MKNEFNIKKALETMISHSNEIIKNNSWEDVDFEVDCRSYEEGYQRACRELLFMIPANEYGKK